MRFFLMVLGYFLMHTLALGGGLREVVSLSGDQAKAVKKLGWPATFLVVDGLYDTVQPEGRVEMWNYPGIKKTYSFKNGRFMGDGSSTQAAENNRPNPIHPTFFNGKMKKGELLEVLGKSKVDPIRQKDRDFGDVEAWYYPQYKLLVGFKEDHLLFAKTLFCKPPKEGKK